MIGVGDPENVGSLVAKRSGEWRVRHSDRSRHDPSFVGESVRVSMAVGVPASVLSNSISPHDQIMELQNHSIHFAATTPPRMPLR